MKTQTKPNSKRISNTSEKEDNEIDESIVRSVKRPNDDIIRGEKLAPKHFLPPREQRLNMGPSGRWLAESPTSSSAGTFLISRTGPEEKTDGKRIRGRRGSEGGGGHEQREVPLEAAAEVRQMRRPPAQEASPRTAWATSKSVAEDASPYNRHMVVQRVRDHPPGLETPSERKRSLYRASAHQLAGMERALRQPPPASEVEAREAADG